MRTNIIFCLCISAIVAVVLGETTEFIAPPANAAQLVVEQDMQRHFGDVVIGLQQSNGFASMARAKYLAGMKKHHVKMQNNYGNVNNQQTFGNDLSKSDLEKQSTVGKIVALKYFFLQLLSTQSDVQMSFYINRAFAAAYPQISMMKLYKNYLSIFAISSALQLHDSFTLEAYLEDFNQEYKEAGKSSLLTESVAEFNLYNNWQQLASMRLYLVYFSMFDGYSSVNSTAYLETESTVESEAQPSKQDAQSAMFMQYMYMVYFSSMLRFYCLFTELSIPQYGVMMAYQKLNGYTLLTDDTDSNDDQGYKLVEQAEYLDDLVVPGVISQWAQLVSTRYMIEFYVLMFEMYLPNFAAQRSYLRADSAMLNTNVLQTEQPKVQ